MFSNKRKFRAKVSAENKTFWKEAQIDLYRNFTLSGRHYRQSDITFVHTNACAR